MSQGFYLVRAWRPGDTAEQSLPYDSAEVAGGVFEALSGTLGPEWSIQLREHRSGKCLRERSAQQWPEPNTAPGLDLFEGLTASGFQRLNPEDDDIAIFQGVR